MDMSELKELIELFEQSSVAEMEFERGELRVCLRRESTGTVITKPNAGTTHGVCASAAGTLTAGGTVSEGSAMEAEAGAEPESELVTIDAPMVGVFYSALAPEADPFVTIDQSIGEGETVAIISAMKVMNEIKSEISGIVRKILVENGQPVEYNQPLFAVEPAPLDEQPTSI